MKTSTTIADIRDVVQGLRAKSQRVALVPTMGALHPGHLALVDEAHNRADAVIVSIFVNPLQFGPTEDLAKYPRTLDADLASLAARNVTAVFTPNADEMYANNRVIAITATGPDAQFEGAVRPGHFTGVLTVVAKLFNIVQPDVAIFGQKDLQQLSLIRRMVRELNYPIEIIGHPTIREPDGLAMSSRNRYLDRAERQRASRLSAALNAIKVAFDHGTHDAEKLRAVGRDVMAQDPEISVDYLDLVDPNTFERVTTASPHTGVIIAARVGTTRLIDNLIL